MNKLQKVEASCIHSDNGKTWSVMLMDCGHLIGRKIPTLRREPLKHAKCEYCNNNTKIIEANKVWISQIPKFNRDPNTGMRVVRVVEIHRRRSLIVSFFFLHALSYYDKKAILGIKEVQEIAKRIRKINFTIEHGPPDEKKWTNQDSVNKMLRNVSMKKKVDVMKRAKIATDRKTIRSHNWDLDVATATKIWHDMEDYVQGDVHITINMLLIAILRKEPAMAKKYGFKAKFVYKFGESLEGEEAHAFSSLKVASRMLEQVDEAMKLEPLKQEV